MKIIQIYEIINDKTWILQVILGNILILFISYNESIMSFIKKIPVNNYLLVVIIWIIDFILIRFLVLLLSCLIYLLHRKR